MARKKTIMREHILDGAVRILKRDGISSITARNVANELNCSTQPIYNEFNSMDGLKEEILKTSIDMIFDKVFSKDEQNQSLLAVSERFIAFAKGESPLFYSLYVNQHNYSQRLHEELYNNMEAVINESDVNSDSKTYWSNLYPLLYGLATLIALDNIELSDNEIKTRVKAYIETAKNLSK